MEMKVCSRCFEEKELTEFYSRMKRCKKCHRQYTKAWQLANPEKVKLSKDKWRANEDNKLKERKASREWQANHPEQAAKNRLKQQLKLYGLSLEQFEKMSQDQNGQCFICKKIPSRRLDVDHNHTTGEVRRLLCSSCNTLVGLCGESIEILQNVIKYLQTH